LQHKYLAAAKPCAGIQVPYLMLTLPTHTVTEELLLLRALMAMMLLMGLHLL
jgi:hypothetical protein